MIKITCVETGIQWTAQNHQEAGKLLSATGNWWLSNVITPDRLVYCNEEHTITYIVENADRYELRKWLR